MGNFNHLPTDILIDIITRLPTESILDCKLVCRPWRNLVSHHPSFSLMHLTHLNRSADSGKLSFLLIGAGNRNFQYFEYIEKHEETPIHSTRRFNLTLPFTSSYWIVVGSFNGLVCVQEWRDYAYFICNPVTREYVMLPKIERDSECGQCIYLSSGFGCNSVTNEYKVVELFKLRREPNFIQAAVYTLGSGNGWRIVGRFEFTFPICYAEPGVYANRALHWANNRDEGVLVFDLTEEEFHDHPPLPPLSREGFMCHYDTIGELGGVLYCSIKYYFIEGTRYDILLLKEKNDNLDMKEQVEHQALGWRKEFSVPGRKPLSFTKSGGVLCFDDSSLRIYDPIALTFIKLVDFSVTHQIIPHQNTLVLLKELGEEDIRVMESAKIEETETPD